MMRLQLTALAAAIGLTGAAQAQEQTSTTNYVYDTMGNLKQVTDPLNQITKHDYDALNRRIKTTDAKNGATQFGYDGLDQLSKVTDARNLATSYTIYSFGNLSKTTSPDTGITSRTYDEAGNLKSSTDAKNQVTAYQYDALNRVTLVTYGDGSSAAYVYDQGANAIGRLSQVTDVSGVMQFAYDQQGRVTQESRSIGGQAYVTAYRYDDAGRLTGMTYPSGRKIDYTFDSMGRIATVTTTVAGASATLASGVTYQPFGPLKSLTFGNGQVYSRSYDLNGRMTSFTLNGQAQTVSYDAASRVTGVTDGGNTGNSRSYGYDQLDRLTSELYPNSSRSYAYDAVGNRTQSTLNAATTNYTYAAASNRLTQAGGSTIGMDANGSITDNGAGTQFSYDARGRMVAANTAVGLVTYKINALGQRVQKYTPTATTVFHYDLAGRLIAETAGGATTEYVYLDDMPVAVLKHMSGPLNVSGLVQLTQHGAVYNRVTGKYVGSVAVTNKSGTTLAGPLQLKLSNLTAVLTLDNASGADAGAPYVTVPGPLNPGAAINVPLTFSGPARSMVTYTPVLYQGSF